jgi:hypothetical protein
MPEPVTFDNVLACPDGIIFMPTGEVWPMQFIDKTLGRRAGLKASEWLAQHRGVQQMTWAPGEPELIEDKLINQEWKDHAGARVFNLYKPPTVNGGEAKEAQRWVELIDMVYPETSGHVIAWMAFKVQFPGVKINHALILGGSTRVGKDTIIEPLRRAVGYANTHTVAPTMLLGAFNGYFKAVVLVVSEARDQGEMNRYQLYEHMKQYTAAPPMTLRINEKNRQEYYIPNVCGIIYTTNHKDGLYLPFDDARHHGNWSPRVKDDFTEGFWRDLWRWYETENGYAHVAAYLREYDVSLFNPKAPPERTEALREMMDAGRAPESSEMADLLEAMGWPSAVTIPMLIRRATGDFLPWLQDRKNRKQIGRRLADCDMTPIRNPDDKRDGQWRIGGQRVVVFARIDLSESERFASSRRLADGEVGNVVDFPSHTY